MDKYSELARLLRKNGWEKQGGTNHEKWVKDGKSVRVPRHAKLNKYTVESILKQCGIKNRPHEDE